VKAIQTLQLDTPMEEPINTLIAFVSDLFDMMIDKEADSSIPIGETDENI